MVGLGGDGSDGGSGRDEEPGPLPGDESGPLPGEEPGPLPGDESGPHPGDEPGEAPGDEGTVGPSPYIHRVRDLAEEAREARRTTDVGAEPDPEAALEHARDGLGPVVALYVEAHTGGRQTRFSGEELSLLHRATGDWLTCYARAHGVDHEAEVTVREAAEVLLDTHDVTDVARLLTGVPGRGASARE